LADITLNDEFTLEQTKTILSKLPGVPNPSLMRIRDIFDGKMGKVWAHNALVKKNSPGKDYKEIVIQALEKPEELTDQHILINIRQWLPDQFKLAKTQEVPLFGSMTIDEFKIYLCPLYSIPPEDIRVVKPRAYKLKNIEEIPQMDWFGFDLTANSTLAGKPWNLHDGDIVLFKDNRVKEKKRELPKPVSSSSSSHPKPVEHGIKIYSIEEMIERQKKEQEEEKTRKEEEEKLRAEAAQRIKLGLAPTKTAEDTKKEQEENIQKALRAAEAEKARDDAIERARQFGTNKMRFG